MYIPTPFDSATRLHNMNNLFIPFELHSNKNNYEWLVRGIGQTLDEAIGLVAQNRLIASDEFDPGNWVIEEVPVGVALRTTPLSEYSDSVWIVSGAIAKYDIDGTILQPSPD